MSIKLFVNPSPTLAELVSTGEISIDGLEVTPFHSPRQVKEMRRDYPGLPFQFHASNTFRTFWSESRLRRYHAICHESRWISIHLAIVPAWAVFTGLKFGIKMPMPSPDRWVKRLIVKLQRLKENAALPVILENMPASAVLDNLWETDPRMIQTVLRKTGCQMLLDLAHARVAADFHEIRIREYIEALPLSKVRQLHISGVREVEGKLFDAHETLQKDDYEILAWVLTRTNPEILTLEYFYNNKEALQIMLKRLRVMIESG